MLSLGVFEVRVSGLRFRGFHGVFESEREHGNEFLASVVASVEGSADETDSLADTVDYSALAGLMGSLSESRSFMTVEGLAGSYAALVLERFPLVSSLEVVIDKLSPPMSVEVESCGVRLVRKRA